MSVTILHHLGLGDQIMLNGMVRHFAETEHVYIYCKKCHEDSVKFMYRDICDKVSLILVETTNIQEIQSKLPSGSRILPLATYGMENNVWHNFTQATNWAHGV